MKLLQCRFIRNFLYDHGYYRISDLQAGGHCGLCGTWCSDAVVEKDWSWTMCDDCAGIYRINVAKEFTDTPGGRHRTDGKYSGEEFREEKLEPLFLKAKEKDGTVYIDFDGGFGYLTSFLEEAFGGLARKYGVKQVSSVLKFKSQDEHGLIKRVHEYIRDCNVKTK